MFSFLKNLFASDTQRRNEPVQADQARKLEMDEPMAAAGAQLSGEKHESETEKALKAGD